MMPVWIFTLGKSIFEKGDMKVPYGQIASYTYGLLIPLVIGLLIQRYCPKIARFLVRILKTGSAILIIFIVIFAIATNLYLFKLFTWEVNKIPTIICTPIRLKLLRRKLHLFLDFDSRTSFTISRLFRGLAGCSSIQTRI